MQINPYSIPPALCSILALGLAVFALIQNPKSRVIQIFSLQCLTIILWLSYYSILYNAGKLDLFTSFNFRISYCGISFIPAVYYHYICELLKIKNRRLYLFAFYFYSLISSVLILKTDYIIKGLYKFWWGPYPMAGSFHPLYLIIFNLIIGFGIFETLKAYKIHRSQKEHNKVSYCFLALTVFGLATLDFIPNYGIEFYPFGYAPTSFFLIIIAYAAIKHQLMDINIVIQKSLVYSILVTLTSITYIIMVLSFERISQSIIGYGDHVGSFLAAIIIAIIFVPLRNRIQNIIDKLFLKKSIIEVSEENEYLRKEMAQAEKLRAVATLASGIAHEIKNPVTVLKTFNEYLPKKLKDEAFLKQYSEIVTNEINSIDQLIHDLLNFAKPSPPSLKRTEIHMLLNETLNLISSQLNKHNILLKKDYLNNEVYLMIDPGQIKQALLNIFLNAIEAMENGGTLTIRTVITLNNQFVEIQIEDTGEGISRHDLSKIFEPFYSKKEKGTGLGLSITNNIIQFHQGRIEVTSQEKEGSCFSVFLPII